MNPSDEADIRGSDGRSNESPAETSSESSALSEVSVGRVIPLRAPRPPEVAAAQEEDPFEEAGTTLGVEPTPAEPSPVGSSPVGSLEDEPAWESVGPDEELAADELSELPDLPDDEPASALSAPAGLDPSGPASSGVPARDLAPPDPSSSGLDPDGAGRVRRRRPSGPDPRIGAVFMGRYRIERFLGAGGMGRVYEATQLNLGRPVAVKVLGTEYQERDPQFLRRFHREAAALAQLDHPCTVTVFDYGEAEGGELFIAMELVHGRSLMQAVEQDGPFPPERVARITMQICRSLREAHGKGMLHRDLKPGNIRLVDRGDEGEAVKVLDFGSVKLIPSGQNKPPVLPENLRTDGELTVAGMFLGSPRYMAPEQVQGLPLDQRTDIYSLGILMFYMLTGKPPFSGATGWETVYKQLRQPPPPLEDHGVEAGPFAAIVRRCLQKPMDHRYGSVGEIMVELRRFYGAFAGGENSEFMSRDEVLARPPTVAVAPPRRSSVSSGADSEARVAAASRPRGRGRGLFVAAMLALALGSGALWAWASSTPAPAPAPITDVRLRVTSSPPGAQVRWDGRSMGRTPTDVTLPADRRGKAVTFDLALEGYESQSVTVVLDGEQDTVAAILERSRPREAADPIETDEAPEDYKLNPY